MQKNKNQFQSSIVWTNTNKFINSLLTLDDNEIISILNEKIHGSVGEIKKIITKQTFPLKAHLNSKFFENRIIIYNFYHILNHSNMFGGAYLNQVRDYVKAILNM